MTIEVHKSVAKFNEKKIYKIEVERETTKLSHITVSLLTKKNKLLKFTVPKLHTAALRNMPSICQNANFQIQIFSFPIECMCNRHFFAKIAMRICLNFGEM